jgi:endonuclease/exonuclease/phosphatase family metal-dependent hydrolase
MISIVYSEAAMKIPSGKSVYTADMPAVFAVLWIACVCALPPTAAARSLRVATFNVEHGIGEPGDEKFEAQKAILRRVNADIVGFQELTRNTSNDWVRLAGELGYSHRVWGEHGPFTGAVYLGFYSRFPILDAVSLDSLPKVRELSRRPLRICVAVPGAAHPLVLWNMHHKALFEPCDDFRRAVEAQRIVEDIGRYAAQRPERIEMLVLGDMNDDLTRAEQSVRFTGLPEGLPRTYALGADIRFPISYRWFPLDVYTKAGPGFRPVRAFRIGTDVAITHLYTNMRLDWIFASAAIWQHPAGPPKGEIYHSEWDAAEGGIPKSGAPLAPETSLAASDHYVVFVDLNLEDAVEPGNGRSSTAQSTKVTNRLNDCDHRER